MPDALTVLEVTLGPDVRIAALDGVRVVRTTGRDDHAPGNAVHLDAPPDAAALDATVADLDRRFPTGRARAVAPWDADLTAAAAARDDLAVRALATWQRDPDPPIPADPSDLRLAAPADDRAWHGVTVLQRHAAPPGEDRSRGAEDERLRWWVEGVRRLVGEGRARVLRADRFGTPVAAGVLHWAPGIDVGPDHAGLAVVSDVVVHPAHRGLGVGRALADGLVARHRADFPRAWVGAVVPGPATSPPAPTTGWRSHAELLTITRR